jgi:putative copper export protein
MLVAVCIAFWIGAIVFIVSFITDVVDHYKMHKQNKTKGV